ncbi:Hypothetical Protein FCC1311_023362 [Hondaea fermentalgiana]|uniref:Uncharacterized protein n=1 Tax=Hondaea fermentalgiana TaxID=2315210 RepID=A0A2R5G513_9STRA|nr:Hypothetical Protein FCC1311_023362 [Hondaea fermentalgiana]|eukprot:GBG26116.1 Hypothetical Protein FCC1311_023362 [Hondaea fermentalgiana]
MIQDLQKYGNYLLFDASHNVTTARGFKLFSIFGIDDMGAGVGLLYVVVNHETVAVCERVFAVLANLHNDPDYKPQCVMCDMAKGPITAIHRMRQGVSVQYSFRDREQKIWLLLQEAVTTHSTSVLNKSIEAVKASLRGTDKGALNFFVENYFADEKKSPRQSTSMVDSDSIGGDDWDDGAEGDPMEIAVPDHATNPHQHATLAPVARASMQGVYRTLEAANKAAHETRINYIFEELASMVTIEEKGYETVAADDFHAWKNKITSLKPLIRDQTMRERSPGLRGMRAIAVALLLASHLFVYSGYAEGTKPSATSVEVVLDATKQNAAGFVSFEEFKENMLDKIKRDEKPNANAKP